MCLNALMGPTNPIIPKPADSLVPAIPNKAPKNPVIIALVKMGNKMIGCRTILGIIILTPPKNIVIGTPDLLIFIVPATRTPSHATMPNEAEPAAKPLIPMASAVATVEIGEMIIKLKTSAISIDIIMGCNSVNVLTKLPIPVVINCMYGNNVKPINPEITPTIVGKIINVRLPKRSPISNIKIPQLLLLSLY